MIVAAALPLVMPLCVCVVVVNVFAIKTALCVRIWENLTRFLSDPLDWVKSPLLLLCHFYLLERWAACYFHHFPCVELCAPGSWWSVASAPQQLLLHGEKCVDSWPTFSTVRVKNWHCAEKNICKRVFQSCVLFLSVCKEISAPGGDLWQMQHFHPLLQINTTRYYMSQHNEP